MTRPVWMDSANCRGADVNVFFPPEVYGKPNALSPRKVNIDLAFDMCEECDVQEECLQYALTNEISQGIWGGMGSYNRDKLIKKQRQNEIYKQLTGEDNG